MRSNGLLLVVDRAARELSDPLIDRYREVIILGSLREDVLYIPGVRKVWEHLSFSHFYKPPLPGGFLPLLWPGPRYKANLFFRRGVREFRAGREASGFVQLGRATHLLTDMACPVHVHRVIHDTDLFEWYVESHRPELEAIPLPEVPEAETAGQLIQGLSQFTAQYRPDATQHPLGRFLKRRGIRQPVGKQDVVEQARTIMPMAAAYAVALFRLFLDHVAEPVGADAAGHA